MDDLRIKSLARYMPKVQKDQNCGASEQPEPTVNDSFFGKIKVASNTTAHKVTGKFGTQSE